MSKKRIDLKTLIVVAKMNPEKEKIQLALNKAMKLYYEQKPIYIYSPVPNQYLVLSKPLEI